MCRRRLKGGALVLIFVWLSANALKAQELTPALGAVEGALVRWAMTQGGPSVIAILIAISYRRDLLGVISEQKQHLNESREALLQQGNAYRQIMADMMTLVRESTAANHDLRAAVSALTVEVRREE